MSNEIARAGLSWPFWRTASRRGASVRNVSLTDRYRCIGDLGRYGSFEIDRMSALGQQFQECGGQLWVEAVWKLQLAPNSQPVKKRSTSLSVPLLFVLLRTHRCYHGLAHRIRAHRTHDMQVSAEGVMFIAEYDKLQEDEADWLVACLLLPREALVKVKLRGLDFAEAAKLFGVSLQMLKY